MPHRTRRLPPLRLAAAGVVLALAWTWPTTALARSGQPASPAPRGEPVVTPFVANWTRVSLWSFFEPPPGGGDPTYGYVANRLRVGLRRRAAKVDFEVVLQYVQFGGLPTNATGPGSLGTGALYFDHSGRRASRHVYLRSVNLRLHDVAGVTLQAGRMGYTSGAESASGQAKIEAVKRQRVDSRMIGEFEWSLYQRTFDGVRVDYDRPAWHASAAAFRPTQGGFEEAAGVTIDDIDVLAASLTFRPGRPLVGTDWQVFAYRYDDRRRVAARPDNTGRLASRADVGVATIGTTLVGAYPAGRGEADVVVWVARQTGSWYELAHRAYAVALEAGYQWPSRPWRPWVRAGYLRASGDQDAGDARHGTFFPMLPTARKYAQSATYAPMNLVDLFAQVLVAPGARTNARLDLHRLSLASAADRWYAGSGATQEEGTTFGYAGRPSRGATTLGTVMEGSVEHRFSPRWSVNGYLGVIRGGEVVTRTFAGRWLTFGYVEHVVQF